MLQIIFPDLNSGLLPPEPASQEGLFPLGQGIRLPSFCKCGCGPSEGGSGAKDAGSDHPEGGSERFAGGSGRLAVVLNHKEVVRTVLNLKVGGFGMEEGAFKCSLTAA